MKITHVEVDDPGRTGWHNAPTLKVFVDAIPEPTGDQVKILVPSAAGYYTSRHHGPLVRFAFYYDDPSRNTGAYEGGGWSSRAGAYNAAVKPDKQVMDVTLYTPEYKNTGLAGYALETDRAAREIKKHQPDWRLGLNESAAQLGDIAWVPQELIPSCLWRGSFSPGTQPICGKAAFHPYMGRPLGLCDACKIKHDQLAAENRAKLRR